MIVSRLILPRRRNDSEKRCGEKHTCYVPPPPHANRAVIEIAAHA